VAGLVYDIDGHDQATRRLLSAATSSLHHRYGHRGSRAQFIGTVPMDESLRPDIAYNNAAKLLGL
jgi:hypothetical protein